MSVPDLSGYWTGEINGTNRGGFILDVKQDGYNVTGIAKIHEPALGKYEYTIASNIEKGLSLRLMPSRQSGNLLLGVVQAICTFEEDGTLSGRWKSEIGTEGIFTAKKSTQNLEKVLPKSNSVFLVHGHDEGVKHAVARLLEQLGITPVILHEQINSGMTVIEKFEEFSSRAGFAVILMTPDDYGYPVGKEEAKKSRPRQNVVLELGYFFAKLGRNKTIVLTKGDIEMPSDVFGLVYETMNNGEGWKMHLAKELKAAGFPIDMNKIVY
jgi:predicted nucleotide-binding protein